MSRRLSLRALWALVAFALPAAPFAALYDVVAAPANLGTAAAVGWPSNDARAAAVAAAIAAPFAPLPAATKLRCALIDIGVSHPSGQLRDPFAGYAYPMGSVLADAVRTLPYGAR